MVLTDDQWDLLKRISCELSLAGHISDWRDVCDNLDDCLEEADRLELLIEEVEHGNA